MCNIYKEKISMRAFVRAHGAYGVFALEQIDPLVSCIVKCGCHAGKLSRDLVLHMLTHL